MIETLVTMETALSAPSPTYEVDYREDLVTKMAQAWDIAKSKIRGAQDAQKVQYDQYALVIG